jgi:hypothetical protein
MCEHLQRAKGGEGLCDLPRELAHKRRSETKEKRITRSKDQNGLVQGTILLIDRTEGDNNIDPYSTCGKYIGDEFAVATPPREDSMLSDELLYFGGEEGALLIVHSYDGEAKPLGCKILFVQE